MDIAEIFTWYFEQKGVENPERFLDQEKLQFMKQNEKIQMLAQNNNITGQLNQMMSQPVQKDNSSNEQLSDEKEDMEQESNQSVSILPKLYELAKEHILSKNKEN